MHSRPVRTVAVRFSVADVNSRSDETIEDTCVLLLALCSATLKEHLSIFSKVEGSEDAIQDGIFRRVVEI